MGWLAQHLNEFVRPVLGYVPEIPSDYKRFFLPQEMAVIKNTWRVAKCDSKRLQKPLLLAGRDVFVFEILARREGFPTTFRPDISRRTVNHVIEDYSGHYLLDTGFMGSIPRALKINNFSLASSNKVSPMALRTQGYGRDHRILVEDTHQAFPRMTGARSLALKIERTPKYWRGAFYRSYELDNMCDDPDCNTCQERITKLLAASTASGIGQEYSNPDEFTRAALLTMEIYTDSSPAFVEGRLENKKRLFDADWLE